MKHKELDKLTVEELEKWREEIDSRLTKIDFILVISLMSLFLLSAIAFLL